MAAEKNKAPALNQCHYYSLKSLLQETQKQYLEDSFSCNSCYATGFESQGQNCAWKGPFSPTQLVEFHRQMTINYHIMYNVPVPPNFLIDYEKSIEPKRSKKLSNSSGGSGSSDPNRCHRTDGKKWRCSRNVVHDKKYCERHLKRRQDHAKRCAERTRERAAKKRAQRTEGNAASKYSMKMNSGASNKLQVIQQANQGSEIGSIDVGNINRLSMNKVNVGGEIQNLQIASDESFNLQFGFPSSESIMDPLQLYLDETFGQLEKDQYPFLDDFIDEFSIESKTQSAFNFPEMQASEIHNLFPLSSIHGSLTLEPSLPSEQFLPVPVGLGVEDALHGTVGNQTNISPFSCEGSIGGPLGEMFNNYNNSKESKQFDATAENNNSKESEQFDATAEKNTRGYARC